MMFYMNIYSDNMKIGIGGIILGSVIVGGFLAPLVLDRYREIPVVKDTRKEKQPPDYYRP